MCTIVLATRCFDDAELVIAANRDEALDRPAKGPRVRSFGGTRLFAPLDLRAGGTWFAVHASGLVAAITNRASGPGRAAKRSRGQLVVDSLRSGTRAGALTWAESVEVREYNPFHLLVADREGAFVLWSDEGRRRVAPLEAGLHVLTERDAGPGAGEGHELARTARPARARALAEPLLRQPRAPEAEAWEAILAEHGGRGIEDLLVRIEGANYGTRSAFVLTLGARRRELSWHEGAPRRGHFRRLDAGLSAFVSPPG